MQIHFSRSQSTCTVNLHYRERIWMPLIFVGNGSCMRGYDVHPPCAKWLSRQGCQKELAAVLRWLLGVSATGYLYIVIEEIKSCQPEVKASKSDKRLRSYGHLKICMVSDHSGVCIQRCRRLFVAAQTPTQKFLTTLSRICYMTAWAGFDTKKV